MAPPAISIVRTLKASLAWTAIAISCPWPRSFIILIFYNFYNFLLVPGTDWWMKCMVIKVFPSTASFPYAPGFSSSPQMTFHPLTYLAGLTAHLFRPLMKLVAWCFPSSLGTPAPNPIHVSHSERYGLDGYVIITHFPFLSNYVSILQLCWSNQQTQPPYFARYGQEKGQVQFHELSWHLLGLFWKLLIMSYIPLSRMHKKLCKPEGDTTPKERLQKLILFFFPLYRCIEWKGSIRTLCKIEKHCLIHKDAKPLFNRKPLMKLTLWGMGHTIVCRNATYPDKKKTRFVGLFREGIKGKGGLNWNLNSKLEAR